MLGDSEPALDVLYNAAQKNVTLLTSIIRDVTAFASVNFSNQKERASIEFSVDVKDKAAIDRKAKSKYGGDIFQVKDILRSKITFRNEGELVCGLVRLLRKRDDGSITGTVDGEKFSLTRIKNLLSSDSFSKIPLSPLPTGYRHILLNFRLPDGLIFGKESFCLVLIISFVGSLF
jgi:hypothetical protein